MRIGPQRPVNPDAIVAPQGYRVEALITGLSFPSAISFGPGGELYVAESGGVAGSRVATPRVLRIDPDRSVHEIGRLENAIVGLVYRNGELLIGEDGPFPRILRVTAEGELQIVVDNLPGGGDYGLSGLALDASGALIFGLGTRTNSGVVGLDNVARGWVTRNPEWADVPGADVQLTGVNYVTSQSLRRGTAQAVTGAFKPFRTRSERGETVRGSNLCSGAVYRISADGNGEPERLAWGLRNPVGIACSPDGRVLVTEGGMEERGSRPIAGAPDNLWEVRPGAYFGWPDHASGIPITDPRFRLTGHPQPRKLLENAPKVSGTPAATFAARAGVGRLDFSTSEEFGFVGDALVALSGAWSNPAYAGESAASAGHRVVRVDPRTGNVTDFLVNRQPGPSSEGNSGGLERPFDVRFDPSGEVLYVVDFGEVQLSREYGLEPFGGTGVVWRITPARAQMRVQQPVRRDRSAEQPAPEVAASTPAVEEAPAVEVSPEPAVEDAGKPEVTEASSEVTAPVEVDGGETAPITPDEVAAGEEAPAAEAAVAGEEVAEAVAAEVVESSTAEAPQPTEAADAGEPVEAAEEAGAVEETEAPQPTEEAVSVEAPTDAEPAPEAASTGEPVAEAENPSEVESPSEEEEREA